MSENITHTAIVDDCARIARRWNAIGEPLKEALRDHLDAARLGGVTRFGDMFSPDLLERFRASWAEPDNRPALRPKMAFVAGWLFHRAADRIMKPVFDAAEPGSATFPTDCSVYHDVFIFDEIYNNNEPKAYSPWTLRGDLREHPAAQGADVATLEDLLHAMGQRALIALHTFIPDRADPEGWIERLLRLRQQVIVDIARYADAFARPDQDKIRRFIIEPNFYNRDDPLIQWARALQRGEPAGEMDPAPAVESASEQSAYARALGRGLTYLRAASDFWDERITETELRRRLHVGRPGG